MADDLAPKLVVEDSKADNLDLNDAVIEAVDVDSFDDELVPGDSFNFGTVNIPIVEQYIDPDLADPAADLVVSIDSNDPQFLPVPSIITSSITKTRRVLATGEVVYDIKFNVDDVGANSYEVAYVKQ
jgi:hypothetical protein